MVDPGLRRDDGYLIHQFGLAARISASKRDGSSIDPRRPAHKHDDQMRFCR
jgi:hypothetical protein